jgi:hypothetical protein
MVDRTIIPEDILQCIVVPQGETYEEWVERIRKLHREMFMAAWREWEKNDDRVRG